MTAAMTETFAYAFAVLALLPIGMHLALAAGAPLGRFTLGGLHPGRLPPAWRVAAVAQALLLAGMALVVLDRAGVTHSPLPGVLFWPVAGLTALTALANSASRSGPERRLWGPVTMVMLFAVLGVGL